MLIAALLAAPSFSQAQEKQAGPTFNAYGFALLHMFYGDAAFASRDNAYQVAHPSATNDSSNFYQFSVRGSRLGFKVGNLDTGFLGATGSLVLEYDVQGGYTGAANTTRWSAALMGVRLANGKLDWKTSTGDWQLLFGQDFGLVGPVFANSVTYGTDPIFVRAGKIYRRTPQARVTWNRAFDMVTVNVAAAVLAASEVDAPSNDFGPGNRTGTPDLEGRVMLTVKPNADFFGTVNASYHTHTRRYVTATGKNDLTASIFNVGLDATLTKYAQVKGEYYTNDGAEDGYAGLSKGIVGAALAQQTLKTTGQWAQLTLKPIPELWLAVGTGSEANTSSSQALLTNNTWYKNEQNHVAVIGNASANLQFSFEVAMVKSYYLNDVTEKGNEYSVSTKFV